MRGDRRQSLARGIPNELIEEIRAASDIVDVISERIQVRRAGRNYKALCPFHQEKTPSFNINPQRQIYHCFGCGAGGDVISFLMEYDKLGFLEAVRELADRAGIALPSKSGRERPDDPALSANVLARDYYRSCLTSAEGESARRYCAGRGLGDEVLEEFQVGYAPPGWDGLIKAAAARGVSVGVLEQAGLIIERDAGGHYDRFRDRLMFPLLMPGGAVLGFGGRAFGEQQPKYLNSPETRVYHKSRYLYGLAQTRQAIRSGREAILVEGYMDVLSVCQGGFRNVVASAGTALTPEQAGQLARYCDKVFVAYDGDDAGRAAATRAAEVLVELGLKVRVALFPEDSDPDSYLRDRGPEAFASRLEESLDFIDFFVATNPAGDAESREAAARSLVETIARIRDPIKADLMIEKVSAALGVGRAALTRACEARRADGASRRRAPRGAAAAERRASSARALRTAVEVAERGLLGALVAGGPAARRVRAAIEPRDFAAAECRALAEMIYGIPDEESAVDVATLLAETTDQAVARLLTEVAVSEVTSADSGRLCDDYIRTLQRAGIEAEIRAVERAIESAEIAGDESELLARVARRQELARRLIDLATEK